MRRFYLTYERLASEVTGQIIAVSEGELQQIVDAGAAPARKVTVIPNGVEVPAERPRSTAGAWLNVVAVNRYDHQKNAELVVQIAERLKARSVKAKITVLGIGDRIVEVRSEAQRRQLEDYLSLPGPVAAPREVFREADIFLSTSRWEGMPLAVLEAMSERLPVVATDVVGNRDVVVDGETGYLFEMDDADGAASLMDRLRSSERRALLGDAGRRRVATRHSVERMAQHTGEVYERLLRG